VFTQGGTLPLITSLRRFERPWAIASCAQPSVPTLSRDSARIILHTIKELLVHPLTEKALGIGCTWESERYELAASSATAPT
jgi:hypothetical protein